MATQVQHAPGRPVLTERQRQVAGAIERGLSNREIARELGISERTMKAHSDVLRWKLGVKKRRHIAPAFRNLEGRA